MQRDSEGIKHQEERTEEEKINRMPDDKTLLERVKKLHIPRVKEVFDLTKEDLNLVASETRRIFGKEGTLADYLERPVFADVQPEWQVGSEPLSYIGVVSGKDYIQINFKNVVIYLDLNQRPKFSFLSEYGLYFNQAKSAEHPFTRRYEGLLLIKEGQ